MQTYGVLDLIGNTKLIDLQKATGCTIFGKAEFLNPGGSIKDRIAKYMLEEAERTGALKKGMKIIEPTSGNTGIGLALVGIQKGYEVIIVMPENMSEERKKIIQALGAELVLTPADKNVDGALQEVDRRKRADSSLFVPMQFENPNNPKIHYMTTAPEMWEQLDGKVDVFVSGVGSGGTLGGVGKFLKEKNPNALIVAAEPKNASALLGQHPGFHKIQGIGDGFIPPVLDTSLIDSVIEVTDEDAIQTARELALKQGLLVGISSGCNVWASIQIAKKYGPGLNIATILCDRAERYFSTELI
ncbi:MAG: cysteine synthase A [Thermoclostridium sp.]|nr:cysteine synthase A [Thermoclostridium sp.]